MDNLEIYEETKPWDELTPEEIIALNEQIKAEAAPGLEQDI
jgi:hypothetical protein